MTKLLFGVTGNMGTGKTYLCDKLFFLSQKNNVHFHLLNIDEIRRNVLIHSKLKEDIHIRKELVAKLELAKYGENFAINGADLGEIIFYDKEKMDIYRNIVNPRIIALLEEQIATLEGIILLEWAMLVEDNMLKLVENNLIVTTCDAETKARRMQDSDIPADQLQKRIDIQNNVKLEMGNVKCEKNNNAETKNLSSIRRKNGVSVSNGKFIEIDTSNNPEDKYYVDLFEQIMTYYEGKGGL